METGTAHFRIEDGTDPYAGWCGGRRLSTSGYPIRPFFFRSVLQLTPVQRNQSEQHGGKREQGKEHTFLH